MGRANGLRGCMDNYTSDSCFGNGKDDKILKKYIESIQIQMQCLLPGVVAKGGASVGVPLRTLLEAKRTEEEERREMRERNEPL